MPVGAVSEYPMPMMTGTRHTMGASPAIWITDLVALLTIGLLVVAAVSDFATRTIPDQACIALALLGLVVRLFVGISAAAVSVLVAIVLFALLVLAHARGALGGGDVKLAAAMAVGLAPDADLSIRGRDRSGRRRAERATPVAAPCATAGAVRVPVCRRRRRWCGAS